MFLDFSRGLSAILVAGGHLRSFLFHDAGSKLPVAWMPFYLGTSLGHQAVMVFFVLSGYLVGGSVLKADRQGCWNTAEYAVKRLTRLLVVLVPALLLTFGCDWVGREVLHGSLYDGESIYNSGPTKNSVPAAYGFVTALGNLLFVQGILVPTFGTNGPLWSLANEFWYYVLFPMIYFGIRPRSSPAARLLLLPALGLMLLLPSGVSQYMLIWLLGFVLHLIPRLRATSLVKCFGAASLFAGALYFSKMISGFVSDLVCGLSFALLLWTTLNIRAAGLKGGSSIVTSVAAISYSLYAVHFPIMALFAVLFFGEQRSQPSPSALFSYISVLIAVSAIGGAFWWLFERQTRRLQNYLLAQFIGCKHVI